MSDVVKSMLAEIVGVRSDLIRISSRPPLAYQSNRLYDVWIDSRHLIVKEFLRPDEFQDAPVREFRALQEVAHLDIAPQPIHYHPSHQPELGPVVIYEFMEGQMWDRRCPTSGELHRLAQVWLKMNTISTDNLWLSRGYNLSFAEIEAQFHNAFQTYAAWADGVFKPGQKAADLCFTLLEKVSDVTEALGSDEPALCFCRADPRFANVIQRPDGRLGLVDWEDSGLRDPARDLADIMTHPNQEDLLSPNKWQAFLQPYLAVRRESDAHIEARTHLYLALFPVFWLSVLLQQGIKKAQNGELATWEVNEMPFNKRLQRYLARGLAWPKMDYVNQLEALESEIFFPSESTAILK